MKITIITPSYNSVATIEDTIKSVVNQAYRDLEYIVIDGGSTDGTLALIKKYSDKIAKVISAADMGVYDAMNKGLSMATGEVVGILNSDDFYFDEHVLQQVAESLKSEKIDACYGDLWYVDRQNKEQVVRRWSSGKYGENKLYYGWIPPHPTFFVKRRVYEKYGKFNLDFKIAADYELMLRLLKKHHIKIDYIRRSLVYMREGGDSARSLRQRFAGWRELRRAWVANGFCPPRFLVLTRILSKVGQYKIL